MSESFCGNDCSVCQYKGELKCPGCKEGPGRFPSGDCSIARCCRKSDLERCNQCKETVGCSIREGKNREAQLRMERKKRLVEKAGKAGPLLAFIFWLIIPSTIASVMSDFSISTVVTIGYVISAFCSFIGAIIMIQLKDICSEYGTAGICSLIVAALNALQTFVGTIPFSNLAIIVLGIVSIYNECIAHSALILDYDCGLSEDWDFFWKLYIGIYIAIAACIIIAFVAPILSVIGLLLIIIAGIALAIYKLVLLYKTASVLNKYTA